MAADTKMVSAGSPTVRLEVSNFKREDFKYSDFYIRELEIASSSIRYIFNNKSIIDEYRGELNTLIRRYDLTNAEYNKYRFNPKLMSHDIYGTTELWFLILDANEVYSIMDFDLRSVNLYTTNIYNVLTNILNNEKDYLAYYEESLNSALSALQEE